MCPRLCCLCIRVFAEYSIWQVSAQARRVYCIRISDSIWLPKRHDYMVHTYSYQILAGSCATFVFVCVRSLTFESPKSARQIKDWSERTGWCAVKDCKQEEKNESSALVLGTTTGSWSVRPVFDSWMRFMEFTRKNQKMNRSLSLTVKPRIFILLTGFSSPRDHRNQISS